MFFAKVDVGKAWVPRVNCKTKFHPVAPFKVHYVDLIEFNILIFQNISNILGLSHGFKVSLVICKHCHLVFFYETFYESLREIVFVWESAIHNCKGSAVTRNQDLFHLLKWSQLWSFKSCTNDFLCLCKHVIEIIL